MSPSRWQVWHLAWKIRDISFEYVGPCCEKAGAPAATISAAPNVHASERTRTICRFVYPVLNHSGDPYDKFSRGEPYRLGQNLVAAPGQANPCAPNRATEAISDHVRE